MATYYNEDGFPSLYNDQCECVIPDAGDDIQDENCPECLELGEICGIYIDCLDGGSAAHPIANYTSGAPLGADEAVNTTAITAWYDANVASTGTDKVRYFEVIGSSSSAAPTVIRGPKNKKFTGEKTITYNLRFFPLCHATREFLRALECGGQIAIWYETLGDGFYGGQNGITVSIVDVQLNHNEGEESYQEGVLILEFKTKVSPNRDVFSLN